MNKNMLEKLVYIIPFLKNNNPTHDKNTCKLPSMSYAVYPVFIISIWPVKSNYHLCSYNPLKNQYKSHRSYYINSQMDKYKAWERNRRSDKQPMINLKKGFSF